MRFRRRSFKCVFVFGSGLALICLSCAWTLSYFYKKNSFLTLVTKCNIADSALYFQDLCQNYSKGAVSGSFCDPLCSPSTITLRECMGHKPKDHIVLADWNGESIVLKVDADLSFTMKIHFGQLSDEQKASYTLSTEMFSKIAASSLKFNIFGHIEYPEIRTLVEDILAECNDGKDDTLSLTEALYCFHLVDEQEFVLTLALQGLSGIPKLFGVCGNLYAVEFASTMSLAGVPLVGVMDPRSWQFRVKLAVALIEMVESFEATQYGVLYNCDVQESNFGFVMQGDNLIAKSIDSDFSMVEESLLRALELESNNSCSKNEDCDFVDCKVLCSKTSNKCSGHVISNNLQVVCHDLFLADSHTLLSPLKRGILSNPPAGIMDRLNELLQECANPRQPSNHSSLWLAYRLKRFLQNSIA